MNSITKEGGRQQGKTAVKTTGKTSPDKVEKLLEDYNDVFADIINVLVYDGEDVVQPEYLTNSQTASIYKAADGRYSQRDRDISKMDMRNSTVFTLYGLENQMKIDRTMSVRVMGYDYASYDSAIRTLKEQNRLAHCEADYAEGLRENQHLYPVVTLVLYFGMKRWKTARSLHELVDVPENLKGFVPNYKINVVEVAFLSEETIAKFTSDFRIVAEYFRSKRLGNPNEIMYYNDKVWVHVAELIEFFKTFTTDSRFEKFKAHILDKAEKGEVRMCEMLDFFENKGMEKGRYHSLDKLMEATKMSLEEAMSVLDFSPKEKTGYLEQQKSE